MKYDALGEALIDNAHAYLRAKQPTYQLAHSLIDAVATILAQRIDETVRVQIGKSPAFMRTPAAKRTA